MKSLRQLELPSLCSSLWFLVELEHLTRWADLYAVHADRAREWSPPVDVWVFRNELSRRGDVIYSHPTDSEPIFSRQLENRDNDGMNSTIRIYSQRAEFVPMSHTFNSLFRRYVKNVTAVAIEEGR